jgi:hypothetical protein
MFLPLSHGKLHREKIENGVGPLATRMHLPKNAGLNGRRARVPAKITGRTLVPLPKTLF